MTRPDREVSRPPAALIGPGGAQSPDPGSDWPRRLDAAALTAALVLVPDSYSRNRFYELYKWPAARRARRRAALLRSVVADLLRGVDDLRVVVATIRATICYRLPDLGVRRTSLVDLDELGLVAHMIRHAERASLAPGGGKRLAVAAQRLGAAAGPRARERLSALLDRLYHGR